jgi:uncharacterized protein (TIGR02001 family)
MVRSRILSALAVLLLAAAAPAAAQLSFQVDTVSRYVWRGFDLFAPNNAALQPSLTYAFGETGLSANVWTSFALGDRSTYRYADEIDLTLTYAVPVSEAVDVTVGLIHYGWYFARPFSFKGSTTQELFITAGLSQVFLQPTLAIYYDLNMGSGLYASLKIGHSLALSEKLSLGLSAALGYNAGQWIEGSGFSDLNLGASLPFKAGDLIIVPLINWTIVLMDEVNTENEIWFGLSIIY